MVRQLQTPPPLSRRFLSLSLVLIILAGIAVYANSLSGQFVWDDETLVKFNPYIKNWDYLPKIFTSRLGSATKESGAFYRPIQTLTYLINYSAGRLDVVGYHVVNMILHILAALSVFFLIQRLFRNGKLSLLTALLFVVHPIHTEAVSYIAGRADPLVTFFMFLSFILYLKHAQKSGGVLLCGMAVSYAVALLSKEIGLILPVLILFYHYAFKKPVDKKALAVVIGVLAAYILWRFFIVGQGSVTIGPPPSFFTRLPGVFIALTNYLRLLVLPFGLHMEYGGILFHFSESKAILGIILLALILFYVLGRRKKDPFLFFAAGWFFITLLPSSNLFFAINAYMAEHWLYIPSVGFFLVVSRFLVSLFEKKGLKGFAVIVMVGLLVFYGTLTVWQNRYWNKGIDFYKRMLHYAPTSSRLYNNLAKAYHDAGKNTELVELLRLAIKLQPNNALAHNNLGNAYKDSGNFGEAVLAYQRAIEIDPAHAGPYYNLSTVYFQMDDKKEEALALLNKSIALSPDFAKAYIKLGLMHFEKGEFDKAIEFLGRAMKLNPDDPEVYHNLGYVYFRMNDMKKAEAMYESSLKANPNYAPAYHDLAIIYLAENRYRQAVEYCDRAVALGYADPILLEEVQPYR